jgi:hypothetical protein
MIPGDNNPFFFSVKHIINPSVSKVIYGIRYHETDYYIQKTLSMNDCEQLDNNPQIDIQELSVICSVISEIEKEYKKTPPLEYINIDIFNILAGYRNANYDKGRPIKKRFGY